MADEKIVLPDFLIADLYKSSLVNIPFSNAGKAMENSPEEEVTATSLTKEKTGLETIKFLGDNKKKVSVIVNDLQAGFLPEDDLTFLINILKACQLSLADISIINTAKQEVNFQAVKDELQSQFFLLFDVEPSALNLPFMIPTFQIQKFSGSTIMVAPSLSYLNKPTHEGKLLKTKLWLALKQVFNIQ